MQRYLAYYIYHSAKVLCIHLRKKDDDNSGIGNMLLKLAQIVKVVNVQPDVNIRHQQF